jgi:hypothetical protein
MTSVVIARVGWLTRDDWTFVISGWLKEEFHADAEASEPIVLDGEPGRLLTYHTGAGTGVHSHRLRAFPIHGGILIGWDSAAGHETARPAGIRAPVGVAALRLTSRHNHRSPPCSR